MKSLAMNLLIETKICEVKNREYQVFVNEFCICLKWDAAEFQNKTLANLFSAIEMEQKVPDLGLILSDSILSQKVRNFPLDSPVYRVCRELAYRSGKAMDDLIGHSVFQVVRKCYKSVNPPARRMKKGSSLHRYHSLNSQINSRRRNCSGL